MSLKIVLHVLLALIYTTSQEEFNLIKQAIPEMGFTRALLKTAHFHYFQAQETNRKIHFEYYIEVNEELNWFEAQQKCRTFSAHLATYDTAEKFNSIAQYLQQENLDGSDYWLSGNDLTGAYLWLSTGQKFTDFSATNDTSNCAQLTDLDIPELEKIVCTGSSGFQLEQSTGQNCIYLHEAKNVPRLSSALCYRKKNYICEFRNPKTYTIVV